MRLDRDHRLTDGEQPHYSPQRNLRLAGLAGAGSLLAAVGIVVSGGGSSAGSEASARTAVAASAVTSPTVAATATPTTATPTTATSTPTTATPTTVASTAIASTAAVCTNTYTIVAGDYWTLLADEASVSLDELYAVNDATSATALYPGQTICLPDGATVVVTATTATATTEVATVATAATPAATQSSSSHSS